MDSFKKAKTSSRKNPQGLREAAFYFQASLAAVCQDKEHPELRGGQASNCSRQAHPQPCLPLGGQDPVQHLPGVLLRTWQATAAVTRGQHRERRELLLTQTRQNSIWRWKQKQPLVQPSNLFLQVYKCYWALCVCVCVHTCVFQS